MNFKKGDKVKCGSIEGIISSFSYVYVLNRVMAVVDRLDGERIYVLFKDLTRIPKYERGDMVRYKNQDYCISRCQASEMNDIKYQIINERHSYLLSNIFEEELQLICSGKVREQQKYVMSRLMGECTKLGTIEILEKRLKEANDTISTLRLELNKYISKWAIFKNGINTTFGLMNDNSEVKKLREENETLKLQKDGIIRELDNLKKKILGNTRRGDEWVW